MYTIKLCFTYAKIETSVILYPRNSEINIFSNESEEQEQLTRILTNKIKSLKAPQIKALLEFLDTYELKLKASVGKVRASRLFANLR